MSHFEQTNERDARRRDDELSEGEWIDLPPASSRRRKLLTVLGIVAVGVLPHRGGRHVLVPTPGRSARTAGR